MKHVPFTEAQFIASAFNVSSFPKMSSLEGKPLAEIAFVGKSNVGKSSLINHLVKNGKLAKTSSTPGKTQSINFFSVDGLLALVDLPGYGYAKISKEVRGQWAELIDHYLQNRTTLQLVLLLIDVRRTLTEEDYMLIKWAAFHQKPLLLVFTKTDKLTENQKRVHLLSSQNLPTSTHFLHYSIKDPHARIKLIEKINQLLQEHGTHQ
jgi:GTP-binding protein